MQFQRDSNIIVHMRDEEEGIPDHDRDQMESGSVLTLNSDAVAAAASATDRSSSASSASGLISFDVGEQHDDDASSPSSSSSSAAMNNGALLEDIRKKNSKKRIIPVAFTVFQLFLYWLLFNDFLFHFSSFLQSVSGAFVNWSAILLILKDEKQYSERCSVEPSPVLYPYLLFIYYVFKGEICPEQEVALNRVFTIGFEKFHF